MPGLSIERIEEIREKNLVCNRQEFNEILILARNNKEIVKEYSELNAKDCTAFRDGRCPSNPECEKEGCEEKQLIDKLTKGME